MAQCKVGGTTGIRCRLGGYYWPQEIGLSDEDSHRGKCSAVAIGVRVAEGKVMRDRRTKVLSAEFKNSAVAYIMTEKSLKSKREKHVPPSAAIKKPFYTLLVERWSFKAAGDKWVTSRAGAQLSVQFCATRDDRCICRSRSEE
ncbi:hypothetical protein PILCRDRAFT_92082 [Piloderma croceum F 1598]|uniref:Uncharacterized protein n=1 Tax=Piloderma croceum (strain F 1598) TaxID=765440 RepID=A0A0C3ESF5_PILCF|nr:hypothetical protein PILCRDRAFT_92082 [Piloderma croceum F 1598]